MLFLWDSAKINHIARHGVLPEEAEQALENDPLDVALYSRHGEERLNQIGETDAGRILFVVTTQRGSLTRVVTAYPASRELRALYTRSRKSKDAASSIT